MPVRLLSRQLSPYIYALQVAPASAPYLLRESFAGYHPPLQDHTTNIFWTVVTDEGIGALEATNSFLVIVTRNVVYVGRALITSIVGIHSVRTIFTLILLDRLPQAARRMGVLFRLSPPTPNQEIKQ